MSAEEYLDSLHFTHEIFDFNVGINEYTEEQLIAFAEAYHKAKVNAITDEMIISHIETYGIEPSYFNEGYEEGAKWFKQELLKDE